MPRRTASCSSRSLGQDEGCRTKRRERLNRNQSALRVQEGQPATIHPFSIYRSRLRASRSLPQLPYGACATSDNSRIGDSKVIGHCRSAALILSRSSIAWLCWPHRDSASIFGAILDWNHDGRRRVSLLEGHDPAPEARGSPDAGAQTFQLHDLAVIDEEIHLRPIVLDIPGEDLRIGGLKHHLFQA
jgi:hypothetical protein